MGRVEKEEAKEELEEEEEVEEVEEEEEREVAVEKEDVMVERVGGGKWPVPVPGCATSW